MRYDRGHARMLGIAALVFGFLWLVASLISLVSKPTLAVAIWLGIAVTLLFKGYQKIWDDMPDLNGVFFNKEDPLMVEAIEKAKRGLPPFIERCKTSTDGMLVKFHLRNEGGSTEDIWGEVLAVSDDGFDVVLMNVPILSHGGIRAWMRRKIRVPLPDVVDWHYRGSAGRLHGMHTTRAGFLIFSRDAGGYMPKTMKRILASIEDD